MNVNETKKTLDDCLEELPLPVSNDKASKALLSELLRVEWSRGNNVLNPGENRLTKTKDKAELGDFLNSFKSEAGKPATLTESGKVRGANRTDVSMSCRFLTPFGGRRRCKPSTRRSLAESLV